MATVLAIVLGVMVGIVSALRQYTGFDYSITFLSFLLYSLPVFWVAVLAKVFLAIDFNDFLAIRSDTSPAVRSWSSALLVGAGRSSAAVAGHVARPGCATSPSRPVVTVVADASTSTSPTGSSDPQLGIVLITLHLGRLGVRGHARSAPGLRNRKALYSALSVAALGAVAVAAVAVLLGLGRRTRASSAGRS